MSKEQTLFFLKKKVSQRAIISFFCVLFGIWSVRGTTKMRRSTTEWIHTYSDYSFNLHESLNRYRAEIKEQKVVGVVLKGDPFNPWYRQSGIWFEKKIGLSNQWIVFVEKDTNMYRVRNDFHYDLPEARIKIRSVADLSLFPSLPKLYIDEHGSGRLEGILTPRENI